MNDSPHQPVLYKEIIHALQPATLLDMADTVSRAIDNVQASVGTDGLTAALRNLESTARQCIHAYERREEVITGG